MLAQGLQDVLGLSGVLLCKVTHQLYLVEVIGLQALKVLQVQAAKGTQCHGCWAGEGWARSVAVQEGLLNLGRRGPRGGATRSD